jgi:hypothetical protein
MSKRHTLTVHRVITVSNDISNDMDGVMRGLAKMTPQRKEDIFFTVKLAQ